MLHVESKSWRLLFVHEKKMFIMMHLRDIDPDPPPIDIATATAAVNHWHEPH